DVGELDAYLAWEGDFLLAHLELPALAGHVLSANCGIQADVDVNCGRPELWIRIIDVSIEHLPAH
ncbi:MAG: hypothetical protein H7X80_01570, partial [bacterium]|nr:hypothetical protein [Candidatus Kapabacteria bacterium]